MTSRASHGKRSAPVIGGLVYVGAPGQEQLDYREVSFLTGNHESRASSVRGLVDVGAPRQEKPNHQEMSLLTSQDESGASISSRTIHGRSSIE